MVIDKGSRMSLSVSGSSSLSWKEGSSTMIIGDMDIYCLIVYVHQDKEEKLREREKFKNKKSKTENKSG